MIPYDSAWRAHERHPRVALSLIAFLAAGASVAQDYPTRPVRMVVPFSPGGSTDTLARIVGQKLTERSGQPVIVENRAGAADTSARSSRKIRAGRIYAAAGGVPHAISASLYSKLPYDMARTSRLSRKSHSFPSAIVVHPSLPANSVKEMIALARVRPGQLSYGSAGIGSPNHLSLELFQAMAGVSMVHVPYKDRDSSSGICSPGRCSSRRWACRWRCPTFNPAS